MWLWVERTPRGELTAVQPAAPNRSTPCRDTAAITTGTARGTVGAKQETLTWCKPVLIMWNWSTSFL